MVRCVKRRTLCFVIKQVVASLVFLASVRCATDSRTGAHSFEHLDECPNPITENMAWHLVQGSVVDVTSVRTFRLRADSGEILTVSIANIGEPADSEGTAMLKRMIDGKRMSVMFNKQGEITGDVDDQDGRDIARQLLRAGAATFVEAPAYTLSNYSECLHRIAAREAKAEGLGVWRHR